MYLLRRNKQIDCRTYPSLSLLRYPAQHKLAHIVAYLAQERKVLIDVSESVVIQTVTYFITEQKKVIPFETKIDTDFRGFQDVMTRQAVEILSSTDCSGYIAPEG